MLVDTSGLFCYLDVGDPRHEEAASLFDSTSGKITHNYILAEFVPLCQTRRLSRTVALTFLIDLIQEPDIEVVWVDAALRDQGMVLLSARLDKTYSLCDAVSFVLVRAGEL